MMRSVRATETSMTRVVEPRSSIVIGARGSSGGLRERDIQAVANEARDLAIAAAPIGPDVARRNAAGPRR
jgi:hypothetical protein